VNRRTSFGLLTLIPLVLVACANEGGSAAGEGTDPAALTGGWTLDAASMSALADPAPEGVSVTLAFEDGQAHGSSGCNTYSGGYEAQDDGSISFGALAGTMMACDEARMALESAYLTALGAVSAFTVDGSLQLSGDGVSLTYTRTVSPAPLALIGTAWSLSTIGSGDAVSSTITGTSASLTLTEDGSASGSAGCNTFHGAYTVDGDQLSFGPLATTRMMCPDNVMAQETAGLEGLGATASFTIDGDQLSLLDEGGALLLGYTGVTA
jgi:heat shock protein HslJ